MGVRRAFQLANITVAGIEFRVERVDPAVAPPTTGFLVPDTTLDQVAYGEWPEKRFKAAMDRFLERKQDRVLFELPPR